MRFGRILATRRSEDWRCIAYDALKQHIKASDSSEDSVEVFHQTLVDEIRQVDAFFEKMKTAFELGEGASAADLRKHAVLNYLAVLKILKKHDKMMQLSGSGDSAGAAELLSGTKQRLFATAFFTAISGSDLFVAAEGCSRDWPPSHECPVCLEETWDAAVLPCSHGFCWPCLANCAAQGLNTCPLCRTAQSLEPVNLEIETILGCLADRYYPTNQPEVLDLSRPASPCLENSMTSSEGALSDSCSTCSLKELARCGAESPCESPRASPCFTPTASPRHGCQEELAPRSAESPCESPRSAPCFTPVVSPRKARQKAQRSPPPAPRLPTAPALLVALRHNSLERTREALQDDPDAAHMMLMDNGLEPPLCACVRLMCDEEILRLLIERGAQVNLQDTDDLSPLALLCMGKAASGVFRLPTPSWAHMGDIPLHTQHHELARYERDVAKLLVRAAADPWSRDVGAGEVSCFDLAAAAGRDDLVQLFLSMH